MPPSRSSRIRHGFAADRSRREDGDYVACFVEFAWIEAKRAYDFVRWMALAVLLVAGWGLWFRASHGWSMDLATLGIAVTSAALGLLQPAVLREVVNWGALVAACLVAASTPAPSDRAEMRVEEIVALYILAAVCVAVAHAARDRARAVVACMLASRAIIFLALHRRIIAALAAGSLRSVAA